MATSDRYDVISRIAPCNTEFYRIARLVSDKTSLAMKTITTSIYFNAFHSSLSREILKKIDVDIVIVSKILFQQIFCIVIQLRHSTLKWMIFTEFLSEQ